MPVLSLALVALLAAQAETRTPEDAFVQARLDASHAYGRRLTAALGNSASARERAIGSRRFQFAEIADPKSQADFGRGQLLREAARSAPNDALVQYLWASADLKSSGCASESDCPERFAALTRVQPDNGVGWTLVLGAASRAGDARGVDEALEKIAASGTFDDFFVEAFREWRDVLRRYPPTATEWRAMAMDEHGKVSRSATSPTTIAVTAISYSVLTMPSYIELVRECDRKRHPDAPEDRFERCARAGRQMMRTSSTVMSQMFASAVVRVTGLQTPADIEARRRFDWLTHSNTQLGQTMGDDSPEWNRYFEDLDSTGDEIRTAELLLARHGISREPPADWKPASP
jgi:hypothetical protein